MEVPSANDALVLEPEPTALGPALHPFDRVYIPLSHSIQRSILSGPRPKLPAPSSFTAKMYGNGAEHDLPLRATEQPQTKLRKAEEHVKHLHVTVRKYRDHFDEHEGSDQDITSSPTRSLRSPLVPSNGSPTLGRTDFAPLPSVSSSAEATCQTPRRPFTFASSLSLGRGILSTPLPAPSTVIPNSPSEPCTKRKPPRLHPIFARLEISYLEPQDGVDSDVDEMMTLTACRALADELIPEAIIRKMSAFEIPVRAAGVVDDIQSAPFGSGLRRKSAWDHSRDEQAATKRLRHDQLPGFRSASLPNSPSAPRRLRDVPFEDRGRPETSDERRNGDQPAPSPSSPAAYLLLREAATHLTVQDVLLGLLQCAKRCCFAARKRLVSAYDHRPSGILQCDLVDIELSENGKTLCLIPKWEFSWVPK